MDVRDIRLDIKVSLMVKKLKDYVNEQVNDIPLQRLPIPMYVVATQLKKAKSCL